MIKVHLSSSRLLERVESYFQRIGVDSNLCVQADVVLALLRIGDKEALSEAARLVGRPITVCPPAVPPWPPLPVSVRRREPVVASLGKNTFPPSLGMHGRFKHMRKGMTREQMKARGATTRDISYWTKNGHITWSTNAKEDQA
jgi:hypothetical protein